jgi:hypothetical protein
MFQPLKGLHQAIIIVNNTKEIYNGIFGSIHISIYNSHIHIAVQSVLIFKRIYVDNMIK